MVPSDYLVSTQLQLLLFCCWGCGCGWAVTIPCPLISYTVLSSKTLNVKNQVGENVLLNGTGTRSYDRSCKAIELALFSTLEAKLD